MACFSSPVEILPGDLEQKERAFLDHAIGIAKWFKRMQIGDRAVELFETRVGDRVCEALPDERKVMEEVCC